MQAQSSKAQVVALANGGQDTVNAVKQAGEFGIVAGGQRLVSLLIFLSDLRALGLDTAQGLSYVDGFYWDYDDATRQWSGRFEKAFRGLKPTMTQPASIPACCTTCARSPPAAAPTARWWPTRCATCPSGIRSCVTPRSVRMAA